VSGGNFSAKDFRTWAGTLHALQALKEIGSASSVSAARKNIIQALNYVSEKLGNTRTVCKKYYVNPVIIALYEDNKLSDKFSSLPGSTSSKTNGLSKEEILMLEIIRKHPLAA
jgi:DNA topoisomerase-1